MLAAYRVIKSYLCEVAVKLDISNSTRVNALK